MTQPLAQSRNWRNDTGKWPYCTMYDEWKTEEWQSDRLAWELLDMLRSVKGSDWRLVESMTDAVSVSNGVLTLVVIARQIRG